MSSPAADAMLLAIGLQESRFQYRRQVQGPARGFWQFEAMGGVAGVMSHPQTTAEASRVLGMLIYPTGPAAYYTIHEALADNDVLAACFSRLLLWTDPRPLPALDADPQEAWEYYIRNWRPGRPVRGTWDDFWKQARF